MDAGAAVRVARALASYLSAATVPSSHRPPAAPGPDGRPAGAVLSADQYETAARMLLVEAWAREARDGASASAWVAAGGLDPLPAARKAAVAVELEGALAAAAAARAAPARAPPPADAAAAVTVARCASGGTVAMGEAGPLLKSASFLAGTPDRLAELWGGGGGAGDRPRGRGRLPALPASVTPLQAAAGAALGGLLAYAAFAERRALARGARRAATALGLSSLAPIASR